MTRALNTEMSAAIADATGERCELIEMQFEDQDNNPTPVYLTNAGQDIEWNGQTWQAVGGRLDISELGEEAEAAAPGLRLRLPGVDQSILALVMASRYLGRLVKVFYAALDPAGGTVLDAPVEMFRGRMDGGMQIAESRGDFGGGAVDIDCRVISGLDEFDQTSGAQTNVLSHQTTIPGASDDTYFQHVPGLGKPVYWGSKQPYQPTASTPMGTGAGKVTPGKTPWGSSGPASGYAPGSGVGPTTKGSGTQTSAPSGPTMDPGRI